MDSFGIGWYLLEQSKALIELFSMVNVLRYPCEEKQIQTMTAGIDSSTDFSISDIEISISDIEKSMTRPMMV